MHDAGLRNRLLAKGRSWLKKQDVPAITSTVREGWIKRAKAE